MSRAADRPHFERYVALGDSTTEGLNDPAATTGAFRGWADRTAERLAGVNPELRYANLAIRGRKLPQVRAEQLAPALKLEPDLASVLGGVNDILRPRVDLDRIEVELEQMVAALRSGGAEVLMFTYPDLSQTISLAGGPIGERIARFNRRIRAVADRNRALLADLEANDVAHPDLWSADRLHAGPLGHQRIAAIAADALGLEPLDRAWSQSLPEPPIRSPRGRLAGDARWAASHLGPWIGRRLRGVSSGDGREPKRPTLEPVVAPERG